MKKNNTECEYLHINHFIHRDIKPDNYLIGRGQKSNIVYLIDFGLAKKYRNEFTLVHNSYKENKNLTGTARYASINAHLGIEQSRRDDLEAIGYVILYFYKGALPWQGLKVNAKDEKYHMIMMSKITTSIRKLCDGCPDEFSDYMAYVKSIGYAQDPNYEYLRSLFKRIFVKEKFQNDGNFEWTRIKPRKASEIKRLTKQINKENEPEEKSKESKTKGMSAQIFGLTAAKLERTSLRANATEDFSKPSGDVIGKTTAEFKGRLVDDLPDIPEIPKKRKSSNAKEETKESARGSQSKGIPSTKRKSVKDKSNTRSSEKK